MQSKVINLPTKKQEFNSLKEEIKRYADFFLLLDQIDQRLKKEDPEYKAKYYPDEN